MTYKVESAFEGSSLEADLGHTKDQTELAYSKKPIFTPVSFERRKCYLWGGGSRAPASLKPQTQDLWVCPSPPLKQKQ